MIITDNYNWDSYSIVRSLYEELNTNSKFNTDLDFVLGINSKSEGKSNIRIGFSDPSRFSEKLYNECGLYITNDLNTSKKYGCYYMPCFSDSKYFKYLNLKKETDILFIGVKNHPFVQHREDWIDKLSKDGLNVKCFGDGWVNGFIEGQELVEEINKAHICLDITDNIASLGSRIFQSSMCGTPVITLDREDTRELFDGGKEGEILFYESYDDLRKMLKLSLNAPDYLKRIGDRARKRCLKDHNVSIRVEHLYKHLNDKSIL